MRNTTILTGIVVDIILKDDDSNLLNAVGVHTSELPNQLIVAYPFDSNIRRVPLVGEAVLILQSHSPESKPSDKTSNTRFYYLNPISLQNSIHNNALPGSKTTLIKDSPADYESIAAGNPNTSIQSNNTINLGDGFVEVDSINQVQPFIGDVIIEGRFGHSLRFGYTPLQSNTTLKPSWRSRSVETPITILTNGRSQPQIANKYIIEDINSDNSSIWLTSNQFIPIKVSQPLSTGIRPQNTFHAPSVIINSDRIVLNSKSDYIILSAAKSVNISTTNWSADMDKIFTILEGLVQQVADLVSAKATFATGTGPTGPATNLAQVNQLLAQIKQMSR